MVLRETSKFGGCSWTGSISTDFFGVKFELRHGRQEDVSL